MTIAEKKETVVNSKVYITGIGPGSMDMVTPHAMRIIDGCDVLMGGRRNLELFRHLNKEEVAIGSDIEKVCQYILENMEHKEICVLATGDPGIFSISRYLKKRLETVTFEIVPGISSLQYLCGRLGTNWDDMAVISMHGRDEGNLPVVVRRNKKIAVFTGGGTSPADVCKLLMKNGFTDAVVTVGERLSYPDERIVSGMPVELSQMSFESLSLMIIENTSSKGPDRYWKYRTPGIPDSMFLRGNVPMNKEEVRTIAIAKLRLKEDSIVIDVGAGTGSVSIECALICGKGKVYAVEKEKEAVELIRMNIDKFAAENVTVIEGSAPDILQGLPAPDRVFIGGTGGNMDSIFEWIAKSTNKVRVVVNAISPESVYEALKSMEKWGYKDAELVNAAVSKGCRAGGKHIMKAMNPIYIISAEKEVME